MPFTFGISNRNVTSGLGPYFVEMVLVGGGGGCARGYNWCCSGGDGGFSYVEGQNISSATLYAGGGNGRQNPCFCGGCCGLTTGPGGLAINTAGGTAAQTTVSGGFGTRTSRPEFTTAYPSGTGVGGSKSGFSDGADGAYAKGTVLCIPRQTYNVTVGAAGYAGSTGPGSGCCGVGGTDGIVIIRYTGRTRGLGGTYSFSGGYNTHTFNSSSTYTA